MTIEASVNGGAFADVTPAILAENLTVSFDLSALAGTESAMVEFRVTDAVGNTATTATSIEIEGDVVAPFELVIQLRTATALSSSLTTPAPAKATPCRRSSAIWKMTKVWRQAG